MDSSIDAVRRSREKALLEDETSQHAPKRRITETTEGHGDLPALNRELAAARQRAAQEDCKRQSLTEKA